MTTPVIEILGLEVFAHHGVHEHEQQRRPDVPDRRAAGLPLRCQAARSDRLADAVDYGAVSYRVVELRDLGPTTCSSGWRR